MAIFQLDPKSSLIAYLKAKEDQSFQKRYVDTKYVTMCKVAGITVFKPEKRFVFN